MSDDFESRTAQFMSGRVDPQIEWLENASRRAKRAHYWLASGQLISTISIPAANTLTGSIALSTVIAAFAAIFTGLSSIFGFHNDWMRYRRVATIVTGLKARYQYGIAPFNTDDRHALFVEEIERALSGELDQWATQKMTTSAPKAGRAENASPQPH